MSGLSGFIRERIEIYKHDKFWAMLRANGMQIGKDTNLPRSTWIDLPHCFLISIGNRCGFGFGCAILAHDAMPNEYIDASRVGRVTIHDSCHFGMRAIILPGVEIGPNTIIGSGAVVNKNIPANSVAVGNPVKVLCTLDEYLEKQKEMMEKAPKFPYKKYSIQYMTPERRQEMLDKLAHTIGFVTGGYTAMIEDGDALHRTK